MRFCRHAGSDMRMPRIPGNYLGSDRVSGCGPSCKGLTCTSRWAHPDPEQRSVINGHCCGCWFPPPGDCSDHYRINQSMIKEFSTGYRTQANMLWEFTGHRCPYSLRYRTGTCHLYNGAQVHVLNKRQHRHTCSPDYRTLAHCELRTTEDIYMS